MCQSTLPPLSTTAILPHPVSTFPATSAARAHAPLQAVSKGNPLSYEVSALRGLLIGLPANLTLDFGVLAGATTAAITVASPAPPRLAR